MNIRELKEHLGISSKVIIDECNDPNIYGTKGKIYVDGDGSYGPWFYVMSDNRQHKELAKFMELWQEDSIYRLARFPTKSEATIIRRIIGLGKKRELSEEHKEKLREVSEKYRFANGSEV